MAMSIPVPCLINSRRSAWCWNGPIACPPSPTALGLNPLSRSSFATSPDACSGVYPSRFQKLNDSFFTSSLPAELPVVLLLSRDDLPSSCFFVCSGSLLSALDHIGSGFIPIIFLNGYVIASPAFLFRPSNDLIAGTFGRSFHPWTVNKSNIILAAWAMALSMDKNADANGISDVNADVTDVPNSFH